MPIGSLTVHNLTARSVQIAGFTVLEASHATSSRLEHLRRNLNSVASLQRDVPDQSLPKDVQIEPRSTWGSEELSASGTLAVHIRAGDQSKGGWQCRLLINPACSTTQTAKVPGQADGNHDPHLDLLAMYEADSRSLTLFDTYDKASWMQEFHDNTTLAALSIPGTHNTPTFHYALPSVRCQAVSPLEQLRNGVRFFDVRVQLSNPEDVNDKTLHLVHGAFPISLTGHKNLEQLLNDTKAFLTEHPSETVVLCLKREGVGSGTDAQLADLLVRHYTADWYTKKRIPTLGEVRGKIVLMRRFSLSDAVRASHKEFGLNAESWPDNTASATHGSVNVQDFYQVMHKKQIPEKFDLVCAQMERAAAVNHPWPSSQAVELQQLVFLNFLSASNFFNVFCWPKHIAARLNPAVRRFLCEQHAAKLCAAVSSDNMVKGDGGLGIVICDWVGRGGDWDLVDCILGMNSVLLHKQRTASIAPDG